MNSRRISKLPERQLWKKLKNESKRITWTRLENWALIGTPDLLGYAPSGNFFTLELKSTLLTLRILTSLNFDTRTMPTTAHLDTANKASKTGKQI